MASVGNSPNPWASSYDTYKDCSQGLCSIYCPQWCYIIFPPPPPLGDFPDAGDGDGDTSRSDFSPLIIAVIGILASAFILLSYYTIIAKYCRRRSNDTNGDDNARGLDGGDDDGAAQTVHSGAEGLEDGVIKAIRVYKYRKSDGFVDGDDCAVCLSEFEEDEGLRLLPKCNHAFHVPCIDTWLKSHSSCPLCRSNIAPFVASDEVVVVVNSSVSSHHNRSSEPGDTVVVVVDGEPGSHLGVVGDGAKIGPGEPDRDHHDHDPVVRRSVSLNVGHGFCSDRLLVADILNDDDDNEDFVDRIENRMQMCFGIGTSSRFDDDDDDDDDDDNGKWEKSGTINGLMRSPLAMRRSISTSRFVFTRYGKGKNISLLPH